MSTHLPKQHYEKLAEDILTIIRHTSSMPYEVYFALQEARNNTLSYIAKTYGNETRLQTGGETSRGGSESGSSSTQPSPVCSAEKAHGEVRSNQGQANDGGQGCGPQETTEPRGIEFDQQPQVAGRQRQSKRQEDVYG